LFLQVSTLQTGGAGIAAKRLHLALLNEGLPSYLLTMDGESELERNIDVLPKTYLNIWQRGLGRLGFSLTEQQRWKKTREKAGFGKVSASSIRSDSELSEHPWVKEASLINLHWVSGILDWPTFFGGVNKPLVWTMHDMNPFMGCFHYEVDRERAGYNSERVERDILFRKEQILTSQKSLTCVAPSKWLSDKAMNSNLFAKFQHKIIPNGLDINIFKQHQKKFARSVFNLPTDKRIMLAVSESLGNYRKGIDIFIEALSQAKLGNDWQVAAVGHGNIPNTDQLPVQHIGSVSDERLMALLYAAADLFVISTREDNLPNVVLESLSCGTPVVGTPVGGVTELIVNGENGFLAEKTTPGALARAIEKAFQAEFDVNAIRQSAAAKFDGRIQARNYKDLYDQLLKRSSC